MAKADVNTGEVIANTDPEESDFQWENVHEEAPDQVILDTPGDVYFALYTGNELIEFDDNKGEHQEFWQYRFRKNGSLQVMNGFYELDIAMKEIPAESMVRITLVKMVDVGQASKMKSIRVDVAKSRA